MGLLLFGCSDEQSTNLGSDSTDDPSNVEVPFPVDVEDSTDGVDSETVDATADISPDLPGDEPDTEPIDTFEPGDATDRPDSPSGPSCFEWPEQPSEPLATIYFGDFDVVVDEITGVETHTMDIMLDTTVNIHAYEMALCGVTLETLDDISGLAADNGLGVRTDGIWVAGFSGSGSSIPADSSGRLFTLAYTVNEGSFDACFTHIGLFDSLGFPYEPIAFGPCYWF